MKKPNITPGKWWALRTGKKDKKTGEWPRVLESMHDGEWREIGTVKESDAKFIAAAPQLAEALEGILHYLKCGMRDTDHLAMMAGCELEDVKKALLAAGYTE